MLFDYYQILGVKENCSLSELKMAFRQKAKIFHPDVNNDYNAQDNFIKLNEAYLYLKSLKETPNIGVESELNNVWKKNERERAKAKAYFYARMRYEEYKKSKVYKASRILNPIFLIIALPFGIFMFTSPFIFITYNKIKGIPVIFENYVALAGFSIIGIIAAVVIIKQIKYNL
ncbi:J domain-containing protein [Bacteroidota bacterium]